ncbi:hypothetical protein [Paenibacillus periandrae]|uniref:hypothetical protein n=1 Tax=Paenibacillus periandrae TaxID=1761741 RepID=UPI001F089023|nr:hypothetical protein [Paenibacillus periandrae]
MWIANLSGETVEDGFLAVKVANVSAIEDVIELLITQHTGIKAVGIGIPGLVHQGVINVCDIAELINVPLARLRVRQLQSFVT